MTDKAWPKDYNPANFGDICDSVIKAIRYCYKLERKNKGKTCPWTGLDIGERDKVHSFSPSERLSNLRYDEEEQGRDALQILISIAVALGVEQGRRIIKEDYHDYLEMMSIAVIGLKTAKNKETYLNIIDIGIKKFKE